MTDKFTKVVLTGILICLIIIAFKPKEIATMPAPDVNVDSKQQFIQVAPNRIGIVDSGIHTGNNGQLIIFDFDPGSKTFNYIQTLDASYILDHPEEYGIPSRSN